MIADSDTFLHDIMMVAGLLGFTFFFLNIRNLTPGNAIAWLFLLMILIVRPLGEPLFFTNLNAQNAPVLNESPCLGGNLTQEECTEYAGSGVGKTYGERIADRGFPNIHAYSPQLALMHGLNKVNVGLANEFLAPGRRLLSGYYPAIEGIRRGNVASDVSNYHLSEFLHLCAGTGDGAAAGLSSTYISHGKLAEADPQALSALRNHEITAWDAFTLYRGLYAPKMEEWPEELPKPLPPLVCPVDGCEGHGEPARVDDPEVFEVMRAIRADSPESFIKARDDIVIIQQELAAETVRLSTWEGLAERMRNQPVRLAVPLNMSQMAADIDFQTAAEGAAEGIDAGSFIDELADSMVTTLLACGAGAGVGYKVGGVAGAAGAGAGAIPGAAIGAAVGCAVGATVGTGARAYIGENIFFDRHFEWTIGEGSARSTGSNNQHIYTVGNCAEYHMLTDARLAADMVLANRLNQTLSEVLSDEDVKLPDNFDQLTLNDQAMVALQSSLTAAQNKCDGGFLGIDRDCDEEAVREINELLNYAHTQRINNSLGNAMVNAHGASGADPRFVGGSRELIAGAGGFFAPLGVAWQSAIGGFEAGTYSKIMPQIVAFGIALTIMFTPFLYMVGLLVPQFALNVILIPIIGVFYFSTLKVIFTIINILASIFIEADEMNLLHGLQANFPDVVLGNLYGAAFLISAGLLYVFRDPSALVKQASGSADQSSTISLQQAVGTALLGQQVLGGLSKVASPSTAGQISGAIQNIKSGNASLSDSYVNARNAVVQSGEESALNAEHARHTPPEERDQTHARARAKAADDLESRGLEYAKGLGVSAAARKATKYEELDGQYSKPVEHDPAVTQLAEALQKRIGMNARSAQWMAAKAFRNGGPATVQKQTKGPPLVDLDLDAIDRGSDMHMKAFVRELKTSGAMSEFSDIKTRRRMGRVEL